MIGGVDSAGQSPSAHRKSGGKRSDLGPGGVTVITPAQATATPPLFLGIRLVDRAGTQTMR